MLFIVVVIELLSRIKITVTGLAGILVNFCAVELLKCHTTFLKNIRLFL